MIEDIMSYLKFKMADELEALSVVVQSSSFSCCGTILDSKAGIVITIGSIGKGLWQQNENNFEEYVRPSRKNPSSNQTTRTLQKHLENDMHVKVIMKKTPQKQASTNDFMSLDGKVIALWRDEKLEELCRQIFPRMEWTFQDDFQDGRKTSLSLADFALIEVKNLHSYFYSKLSFSNKESATVGQPVTIVGTPFGSECWSVFFNSVSKGIVSNVIGTNNELILTDARCVPGCEGCPVFLDFLPGSASNVYGIVITPFCWRSGEWIGLTLVCSIRYLLNSVPDQSTLTKIKPLQSLMQKSKNIKSLLSANPDNLSCINENHHNQEIIQSCLNRKQESLVSDVLKSSRPCVVLIQCGNTWGSGIITDLENGLVVTCRHILTDGGQMINKSTSQNTSLCYDRSVYVPIVIHDVLSHLVYHDLEILFATSQECALDFALLRVKQHDFKTAIRFREYNKLNSQCNIFNKGENILAIGHSLFGSQLSNGPCITTGILSNVKYVNGIPAMLQSTAAVHCGGSGGAIISKSTGELLGMVTCNTRDASSSSSFPHINFSIPSNILQKLIAILVSDVKERDVYLKDLISSVEYAWHLDSTKNVKCKL